MKIFFKAFVLPKGIEIARVVTIFFFFLRKVYIVIEKNEVVSPGLLCVQIAVIMLINKDGRVRARLMWEISKNCIYNLANCKHKHTNLLFPLYLQTFPAQALARVCTIFEELI